MANSAEIELLDVANFCFLQRQSSGLFPWNLLIPTKEGGGRPNVHPACMCSDYMPLFCACQVIRNEDRIFACCHPSETESTLSSADCTISASNVQDLLSRAASFAASFIAATAVTPIYREVPPTESGITWVHESGRSSQRYLPETVGAGVAIFDCDNDGWMDILLINSGPSTFYHPHRHFLLPFIATITMAPTPT